MQVDKLQASYCAHTRFDVSCLKMKCGPATRASLLAINSTNGYLLCPPPPAWPPPGQRAGRRSIGGLRGSAQLGAAGEELAAHALVLAHDVVDVGVARRQ
jgi:hypothetical protein